MTQKSRTRLRAWLERQSLQQADGSYLIRPFRPMPIVYQVDAETNRRWISHQIAFVRFGWLWIASFLLVGQGWRWGLPVWFAVLLLAGYGWRMILLSGAHRVPRTRWVGPAVIDRAGRYSRTAWAFWFIVSLLLTVLFVYIGLSGRYGPIRADMAGFIVLFAVGTIIFAIRAFRR